MKNIVFFHPSSELYGADKILVYIMKTFSGYRKRLVLLEDGPLIGLVREECPDVEITVATTMPKMAKMYLKGSGIFRFFRNLFLFNKVIRDIKKSQPDVIYVNTLALSCVLYYFGSRKYRKIVHVHEILKNNSFLHKIINRMALKKADALVCVSDAVRNNLQELGYADKLRTVYNGITFSAKESGGEFAVDKSKTNFTLIGRIKPLNKGQNLLLDAFGLLDRALLEKTHLYIVGSPVPSQEYMLKEVEDKIKEHNLEKYVTIVPFINNIGSVYKAMDVVCVPSVFDDPFPTTVLESMFWSRPVIGTRTGGIPEMIDDKVTGFVCNRDDAEDLKNKIEYCLNHPDEMSRMGQAGRKRFEEHFTEEAFDKRFVKAMNEIIE